MNFTITMFLLAAIAFGIFIFYKLNDPDSDPDGTSNLEDIKKDIEDPIIQHGQYMGYRQSEVKQKWIEEQLRDIRQKPLQFPIPPRPEFDIPTYKPGTNQYKMQRDISLYKMLGDNDMVTLIQHALSRSRHGGDRLLYQPLSDDKVMAILKQLEETKPGITLRFIRQEPLYIYPDGSLRENIFQKIKDNPNISQATKNLLSNM